MLNGNVMSGVGAQRAAELAAHGGGGSNIRSYNLGVRRERNEYPLGLGPSVRHWHFGYGDLVSIKGGKIVPFDPALDFAGILDRIGEDRGYIASVLTRGAVCVPVQGLSSDSEPGSAIYASPTDMSEIFSLKGPGVVVGELLAVQSLDRSMGIVGFRLSTDRLPFEFGGSRRGGLVQSKV